MNAARILGWTWRLLLAIALAGAAVVAMPAVDAGAGAPTSVEPTPCHDEAPDLSAEPPCEDGCCPEPDCAPANCRVPAPVASVVVWLLPKASQAAQAARWEAAIPAQAPDQEQLRPPIA